MTAKRDLKNLIRERLARTGERYTTARSQILARRAGGPAAGAVQVIELLDLSADAERLGLRCQARIFPDLAARVDGAAVLALVRDALLATEDDPATEHFRAAMLRGEQPSPPARSALDLASQSVRFIARARAGLGGISASGHMLAIQVTGRHRPEMVVCLLSHWLSLLPTPSAAHGRAVLLSIPHARRPPYVILMAPDEIHVPLYAARRMP